MSYDNICFNVEYNIGYIKNNYIAQGNSSIYIYNNTGKDVNNITINSSNSSINLGNSTGITIGNNNY
jgi:hypothetical protein